MRNVLATAFVSLDGVMQAPGGPEEDPTGGFQVRRLDVPTTGTMSIGDVMGGIFSQPYELLLGRKTYEIFAAHWPHTQNDPFAEALTNAQQVRRHLVASAADVEELGHHSRCADGNRAAEARGRSDPD